MYVCHPVQEELPVQRGRTCSLELMERRLILVGRSVQQQQNGNCNAPRAVTLSAIIYCLRCMVGYDVPLNQVGGANLFL